MNPKPIGNFDIGSPWLSPVAFSPKGRLMSNLTIKTDGTTTILKDKPRPWFKTNSYSYGSTS